MWVRGLKLKYLGYGLINAKSHPMWVRGLKLAITSARTLTPVAPYVGAWIETDLVELCKSRYLRRTLCGCVD